MSQRVTDLLASMSLTEKIGQMTQLDISTICTDEVQEKFWDIEEILIDEKKLIPLIKDFQVGSFLNGKGIASVEWIKIIKKIQKLSVEHQLHNIPIIYGIDHVLGTNYVKEG
ncbi:MAG: beta-glucosidase, partial [Bacteroidota bacterium]